MSSEEQTDRPYFPAESISARRCRQPSPTLTVRVQGGEQLPLACTRLDGHADYHYAGVMLGGDDERWWRWV